MSPARPDMRFRGVLVIAAVVAVVSLHVSLGAHGEGGEGARRRIAVQGRRLNGGISCY